MISFRPKFKAVCSSDVARAFVSVSTRILALQLDRSKKTGIKMNSNIVADGLQRK